MARPGGGSAERPGLAGAALSPAAARQGPPGPRPSEWRGSAPPPASAPTWGQPGSGPPGWPEEDSGCGCECR